MSYLSLLRFIGSSPLRFPLCAVLWLAGAGSIPAAVRVWSGGALASGFWKTPANWVGGVAPSPKDTLVFPPGADRLVNTNNFDPETLFFMIIIGAPDYELHAMPGANLRLTEAIRGTNSTGNSTFLPDVSLFSADVVIDHTETGGSLTLRGEIDNRGQPLRIDSIGRIVLSGGIHGSGGLVKTGPGSALLAADNGYTGGTEIRAGTLIAMKALSLGSAAAGTLLAGGDLKLIGVDVSDEPLGVNNAGSIVEVQGSSSWSGPIALDTRLTLLANVSDHLTLSGLISGIEGLTKSGEGTVRLSGVPANSYSGRTTVLDGVLELNKTPGHLAIPNALVIGSPNGSEEPVVRWLNNHQISSIDSPVTINNSGLLDLNGAFQAVSSLELIGGVATSGGAGQLRLNGDVSASGGAAGASRIEGHLFLNSVTRTFLVAGGFGGEQLVVSATIGDGGASSAGIIKTGTSYMVLSGANDYTGTTTVNRGSLEARHPKALGATAGRTVVNSANFYLNADILAEPLTLHEAGLYGLNTHVWTGDITLISDNSVAAFKPADHLILDCLISGDGWIDTLGKGIVTLTGNQDNTFAGPTLAFEGLLELNKSGGHIAIPGALTIGQNTGPAGGCQVRLLAPNQIADRSELAVRTSGILDLNGFPETVGSLAGPGSILLGSATLISGDNNLSASFAGTITGGGGYTKRGSGTQTFLGKNSYFGNTTVLQGTLLINGNQANSPLTSVATGATLGGNGFVAGIHVNTGGNLNPGVGPGVLSAANDVILASAHFNVELNGLIPGTEYDWLRVGGILRLGGTKLNPSLAFTPSIGDRFTLVQVTSASPVQGIFSGLPEGGKFAMNGMLFRITYVGGSGNDVVIQHVPVPAAKFDGITPAGNRMELKGAGCAGITYTIEASTDLADWHVIGSDLADANGLIDYIDGDAPLHPHRFYRIGSP